MVEGFPERPSVAPGEELVLRVATDAPAFRVDVYRWGAEVEHRASTPWLEGRPAPPHLPHQDWGRDGEGLDGAPLAAWAPHALAVGEDWPSGVYVGVLVEGDGRGPAEPPARAPALDARSARVLFVVRPRPGAEARVLYKVPLFTYHAYNLAVAQRWDRARGAGGWCLYSEFDGLPLEGLPAVSLRRPGGGTGAATYDTFNPDPFDPTPRQTFVHWDHRALAWLEREGVPVDVCTDLDLHERGAGLLAPHRLLLSFGHDEYWSAGMRDGVEAWTAGGGNAAFFGGNTAWWRVTFDDPWTFRRAGHWSDGADPAHPARPENAMTGVSFRNGGERPLGRHGRPVGFVVQHADHPLLAGTGLGDGAVFGDGADEHLVGYECDGAHFDRAAWEAGRPARPSGLDGTPAGFTILAVGDVARAGWGEGNRAATLGFHEPGGTVVTGATTDWPRVLAQGHPVVAQITRNVLDALG